MLRCFWRLFDRFFLFRDGSAAGACAAAAWSKFLLNLLRIPLIMLGILGTCPETFIVLGACGFAPCTIFCYASFCCACPLKFYAFFFAST